MFGSIFAKTLYDKRWFFLGWTVGSVALLALTAAFFPVFKENGMDQLFNNIPDSLKSIMGNITDYSTFSGYVGSAVYGVRAQMLFVPMAVLLGYSLSISEESRGALYQLLAQPVSRTKNILQKYFAGVWLIFWINLFAAVSILVVAFFINENMPWEVMCRIGVMTFLFSLCIYSLTYGLGAAWARGGVAIFMPIFWVMASLIVDAFSSQIDWLKNIDFMSVFMYYETGDLVRNNIDLLNVWILLGVSTVTLLIGWFGFLRRDLRGE